MDQDQNKEWPTVECEACGHETPIPKNVLLGYSPDGHDKVLSCVECKEEFVWTGGEQLFYFDRGLNRPLRCQVCRAKRNERVNTLKREGGIKEIVQNELTAQSESE